MSKLRTYDQLEIQPVLNQIMSINYPILGHMACNNLVKTGQHYNYLSQLKPTTDNFILRIICINELRASSRSAGFSCISQTSAEVQLFHKTDFVSSSGAGYSYNMLPKVISHQLSQSYNSSLLDPVHTMIFEKDSRV